MVEDFRRDISDFDPTRVHSVGPLERAVKVPVGAQPLPRALELACVGVDHGVKVRTTPWASRWLV